MVKKAGSESEPGTPRPDQDVGQYSNCCKSHGALHPVMVKFLGFLIGESGNGCLCGHFFLLLTRPCDPGCAQPAQMGIRSQRPRHPVQGIDHVVACAFLKSGVCVHAATPRPSSRLAAFTWASVTSSWPWACESFSAWSRKRLAAEICTSTGWLCTTSRRRC
jgi:hypothetical protein